MSTELQHVINSIENSNFRNTPYEHCVIENIFSEEFYEELIHTISTEPLKYYPTEYKTKETKGNPTRYKVSLKKTEKLSNPVLQKLADIMKSRKIYDAFTNLFSNINKSKNVGVNCYLFRDGEGFKIAPHPDAFYKILSFIIYLPKDNLHKEIGTIINIKEDGQFIKHDLVEYKRNSGFAFPVIDTSFHSVDEVTYKNFNRDTIANFYAIDSFMEALI
jgi:hypothetical protein